MLLSETQHKYINYFGLAIFLLGLPLSKFLVSLSQIILLVNWLVQSNVKNQLKDFYLNKPLFFLSGIFVIHLAGLLWTSDFEYGFHDVRVKAPIFIIPLVLSSSKFKITEKDYLTLLKIFLFSVFAATVLSMLKYVGIFWEKPTDNRELSIFFSHIRFSLMIAFSAIVSIYLFIIDKSKARVVWLLLFVWMLYFIMILSSLTGLVVLILALMFFMVFYNFGSLPYLKWIKITIGGLLVLVFTYGYFQIVPLIEQQLSPKQDQMLSLKDTTAHGTKYGHYLDNKLLENGYYVNINLAYSELEEAWNSRSDILFIEEDKQGQSIKPTLIRFLASKGLDKDMDAVNSLSDEEIKAIENGIPNVDYMNISRLELRIRETIWEIGAYFSGKNPGGNTLTQRFEYWKMAMMVIKENVLFGVGTGDVKNEEFSMYEKMNTVLEPEYRKRAHNQFLTIFVALGLLGFVYLLFVLFYPFFVLSIKNNILFFSLLIIGIISFFNEDTLETQVGVTFFAGLYSFLLLNKQE